MKTSWDHDAGLLRILCEVCGDPVPAVNGWASIVGDTLEIIHHSCIEAYDAQRPGAHFPDHHLDAMLSVLLWGTGMTSRNVRAVEKGLRETGVVGSYMNATPTVSRGVTRALHPPRD